MRLVIVTAPVEAAPALAKTIVEERLAACANIAPSVRSIYTWKGKIEDEEESLMLIKTTAEAVEALTARIMELHPYDVPEIIALEIKTDEGNPDYLSWVRDSTS